MCQNMCRLFTKMSNNNPFYIAIPETRIVTKMLFRFFGNPQKTSPNAFSVSISGVSNMADSGIANNSIVISGNFKPLCAHKKERTKVSLKFLGPGWGPVIIDTETELEFIVESLFKKNFRGELFIGGGTNGVAGEYIEYSQYLQFFTGIYIYI